MEFLIFIILIFLGLFFGRRAEKNHYASIEKREREYKNIIILSDTDLKNIKNEAQQWELIHEGTVVAIDAFKKLMASFVNLFWWRMKAYESLVDRARREAVLKVKHKAHSLWHNAVINLRIETSSISKSAKKTVWAVESIAYATWITLLGSSSWK